MNPMEERGAVSHLFAEGVPVWYTRSGEVNPEWLSACEEERWLDETFNGRNRQSIKFTEGIPTGSPKRRQWRSGWHDSKRTAGMVRQQLNATAATITSRQIRAAGSTWRTNTQTQWRLSPIRHPHGLVQQAIHQVLSVRYEKIFSTNSYGFRPNKNAHQALKRAGAYVAGGKGYVIDLDLAKFFEEVNHHRLLWLLSTRIGDRRLLKLIHRYLRAGMLQEGLSEQRIKGTPQGSPLSPLLSNIVLDELDKELDERGHSYVRYADDVKIFVSSEQRAEAVKASITRYIENKLKLKVNNTKSGICKGYELNFLGHSILTDGSLGLSKQSEERLKEKLKQITQRNRGISLEQMLTQLRTIQQGWLHYFRYARMKSKMEAIDGWLRRKLKCFRLKQCKRTIGIVRWLRKLGVEETLSWRTALSGKGWWRLSNSPALNIGMNKQWFTLQGYYSLSENHKALHRKSL